MHACCTHTELCWLDPSFWTNTVTSWRCVCYVIALLQWLIAMISWLNNQYAHSMHASMCQMTCIVVCKVKEIRLIICEQVIAAVLFPQCGKHCMCFVGCPAVQFCMWNECTAGVCINTIHAPKHPYLCAYILTTGAGMLQWALHVGAASWESATHRPIMYVLPKISLS
jgi:hypothetical protein